MRKLITVISLVTVIALVAFVAIMTGCKPSASNPQNVIASTSTIQQVVSTSVVDYSNGVYYFASTQADFGNALASFIKTHEDLQIVSMAADDTDAYGTTCGYFVVFKSKE